MTSDLVQQTQARQAAQSPVEKIIRSQESGLAAALADRIGTDRFIRAAVTTFRTTPHLDECSPQSILGGLFVSAQLGLEIGGPRGYAYLVPFKTRGVYEAQLILGYKGLLELAYRSGQMKTVDAFVVRQGDTFRQRWDADRGRVFDWEPGEPTSKPIGAVAYVVTMQGGLLWEYLTEEQILTRRPRYWESTPWKTHSEQMWTKTALKRLFARVRLSADDTMSLAVAADETVQRRIPGLDEHEVEYTAAPPTPKPAPQQARPVPTPPREQPVVDDQRSQYADEAVPPAEAPAATGEVSEEEWAAIERQQYEDEIARQAEEENR